MNRTSPFMQIYQSDRWRHPEQGDFPMMVDVELTNVCNLSCLFCGQQTMQRKKGYMSKHVFETVVDECAERGIPIRLIRWGEPFMHKDIIEYIKYAKKKWIPVHVTTNGTLIKPDQMRAIVDIGLDSIIFSFQGATKEQYEVMRNNKKYDIVEDTILGLVSYRGNKDKPFIHVSSTMTNETEGEIQAFKDYWGSIVDYVGVGKTNLSRLSHGQMKSLKNAGKLEELKSQETIKKVYRPCTEVYQKLSVDWDGKVSACCRDHDNYMTVGSIYESSLYDIWNNSDRLNLFRIMLDMQMHRSLSLCETCYHTYEEF